MEGCEISPLSRDPSDFLVEEYKILNNEVLSRVKRQTTFINIFLAGGGGLAIWLPMKLGTTSFWNWHLIPYMAGAALLWILFMITLEQDFQIAIIGMYVKKQLYPRIAVDMTGRLASYTLPLWEGFREGVIKRAGFGIRAAMAAKYIFVGFPMVLLDGLSLVATVRLWPCGQWYWESLEIYGVIVWISVRYVLAIAAMSATMSNYGQQPFVSVRGARGGSGAR